MNSSNKGFNNSRRLKSMIGAAFIGIVLLMIIFSLVGCSDDSEPIEATWITAASAFDNMSIPLSEVKENKIVHFFLDTGSTGKIAFMAYELDKEIHVRSNVCPPCRSIGFSLQKDTLVCDTCLTTFNAKTGDGINGACVDFPKATVDYKVVDDNIIMEMNDMLYSYENTLKPDWP